jgi:sulfate transport system permease protein
MRSTMTDVNRRILPGFGLSLGYTTLYMSLLVLIPLTACFIKASGLSPDEFVAAVWTERARAAYGLTIGASLSAALINLPFGLLVAWVLVRYRFPGSRLFDAIIDLPFALPTIVAGLVLLALYGPKSPIGINVAFTRTAVLLSLLFVTLPFVVRTVQPVLHELDTEMEDAARSLGAGDNTVFRRIVLPTILPGILSGVTLAFARACGEIGALVIISGNLPYRTEVASVFVFNRIQTGDRAGAAAVAVVLLGISFAVLLAVGGLRRLATRHERA